MHSFFSVLSGKQTIVVHANKSLVFYLFFIFGGILCLFFCGWSLTRQTSAIRSHVQGSPTSWDRSSDIPLSPLSNESPGDATSHLIHSSILTSCARGAHKAGKGCVFRRPRSMTSIDASRLPGVWVTPHQWIRREKRYWTLTRTQHQRFPNRNTNTKCYVIIVDGVEKKWEM